MDRERSVEAGVLAQIARAFCVLLSFASVAGYAQSDAIGPFGVPSSTLLNLLECEGQNDCANWMFIGGSGTAQWNSGAIANLQVTIRQGNSITIRRTDTNRSVTPGLTALYQGTIEGNRVEGTVTWTRGAGNSSTTGNWHATFSPPAAAAPPSASQMYELGIGTRPDVVAVY